MQNMTTRRRYPLFMAITSLLTVTAGIILYAYDSGGFNPDWMRSGVGLGYTIGALAGLVAYVIGNFVIGPTSGRMGALGQEIATSGAGPTPEQASQLLALDKKLARAEQIDFWMLTIAFLTMASARFWIF